MHSWNIETLLDFIRSGLLYIWFDVFCCLRELITFRRQRKSSFERHPVVTVARKAILCWQDVFSLLIFQRLFHESTIANIWSPANNVSHHKSAKFVPRNWKWQFVNFVFVFYNKTLARISCYTLAMNALLSLNYSLTSSPFGQWNACRIVMANFSLWVKITC